MSLLCIARTALYPFFSNLHYSRLFLFRNTCSCILSVIGTVLVDLNKDNVRFIRLTFHCARAINLAHSQQVMGPGFRE